MSVFKKDNKLLFCVLDTSRQVHQRKESSHSLSFVRNLFSLIWGLKDCAAFRDNYGIFLRRNVHANTHVIRELKFPAEECKAVCLSTHIAIAATTIYCNFSQFMLLLLCYVQGKVYITLAISRKIMTSQQNYKTNCTKIAIRTK